MCIYDVYRYFEMLDCIIGIFFWNFSCKMFYIGGLDAGNFFLEKCFYMHDQILKILFQYIFLNPKQTFENIFLFIKYFQLKIFYT